LASDHPSRRARKILACPSRDLQIIRVATEEVWLPEEARPEIVTDELRWRGTPETPELVVPLAAVRRNLE
jgi:hypothetical protein